MRMGLLSSYLIFEILVIQRRRSAAADSYLPRCQGRQASERSLVPCVWVEKASTRACQRQSRSLLLSDGPSTIHESFHPRGAEYHRTRVVCLYVSCLGESERVGE